MSQLEEERSHDIGGGWENNREQRRRHDDMPKCQYMTKSVHLSNMYLLIKITTRKSQGMNINTCSE